jgi:hypothetical protein
MTENNREVDQSVTALATELTKVSELDVEEKAALCLVLENALARLAVAIIAESGNIA